MRLFDEDDDNQDRRRRDMRQTIYVSVGMLALAASIVYSAGGASERLRSVENAIVDIRGDVKELRRDVERVDLRTAAMQRRTGVIDEPIEAHASRNP